MLPFGSSTRYRITGRTNGVRPAFYYEDLEVPGSEPRRILEEDSMAFLQSVSADGAWMLYTTDRAGESQLRFAAFPPDPSRDWVVAANGDSGGWFDEARRRILFRRADEDGRLVLWSASYESMPEVRLGRPEEIAAIPDGVRLHHFHSESERFLAIVEDAHEKLTLRLVTNWGMGDASAR